MRFAFVAILLLPVGARADDRLEVFHGASAGAFMGTSLVGHGSRERHRWPSISMIDVRLMRLFDRRPYGMMLGLAFFPPLEGGGGNARTSLYGKLEVGGALVA